MRKGTVSPSDSKASMSNSIPASHTKRAKKNLHHLLKRVSKNPNESKGMSQTTKKTKMMLPVLIASFPQWK
jgi:hypothetical protein